MKRLAACLYILASYAVATTLIAGGYLLAGHTRGDGSLIIIGVVSGVGLSGVAVLGIRGIWRSA